MNADAPKPLPFEPDPVIEAYKKDIDRTLIRENLKLTPKERGEQFLGFMRFVAELREAGERQRKKAKL